MDIKELQKEIAEICEVDESQAALFISTVIEVLKSGLEKDNEVSVDGLGAFRLIKFKNRNQTQLFFYPDDKYKKGVNSAFGLFSPVVIKEGCNVCNEGQLPAQDFAQSENKEAEEEVITNAETDYLPSVDNILSADLLNVVQKVEMSDNENQSADSDVLLSESKIDNDMKGDDGLQRKSGQNSFFSSRSGVIVVIVVLAIAVAFTIWYFFYRMENANKPPVEVEPVEEIVVSKVHELPVTGDMAQDEQAEAVGVAHIKMLARHKVLEGERYMLLSEKYYGNKFYWPYIYEVNKNRFPNPAVVYKFEYIDIPDLVSMGIDVSNPQSLEKAKTIGAELMKSVEKY